MQCRISKLADTSNRGAKDDGRTAKRSSTGPCDQNMEAPVIQSVHAAAAKPIAAQVRALSTLSPRPGCWAIAVLAADRLSRTSRESVSPVLPHCRLRSDSSRVWVEQLQRGPASNPDRVIKTLGPVYITSHVTVMQLPAAPHRALMRCALLAKCCTGPRCK